MKNLLEVGFNVVGFDKHAYVGGLWNFNEQKDAISVLHSTVANGSKHRGCFTDFPFPDETPDFPPAADMHRYLVSYAKHFGILPRAQLNTVVHRAEWNPDTGLWDIETTTDGEPSIVRSFDKVVYSMGPDQIPNIPSIPGFDLFEGEAVHSIAFKRPEEWAGKRVLVVGFGNTAADVACELAGTAEKVYLSHRNGSIVVGQSEITVHIFGFLGTATDHKPQLPRWVDNKPVDHIRTYRKGVFLDQLSRYAPGIWTKLMNKVILGLRDKLYDLKPEWGFDPAPSVNQARPIISDYLVDLLSREQINSKPPIQQITSAQQVEFTDGTTADVDAIIWCTGYTVDYSILGKSDPTIYQESRIRSANGRKIPRLYQNLLSLEHPESLAFMGNLSFMNPAFLMFDLATMALGQVWSGRSPLPPQEEMIKAVDKQHQWIAELAAKGAVTPGLVKGADWLDWVEETAGLGMKENLGYGMQGWWFWMSNRSLCKVLMDGLLLPFHYRLFDGKRKKWDGAEEAILKVNEELRVKNETKKWQ
ncbi:unnamed protein product [Penicillium salamii]|uniref:Uncharacterized protein n=1 Tax=Penicillium salamii TaxID=1612424 RepID=A0A9W4N3L4_9EURO|nr:unnamed protein product [Penicillium salamii]CAG8252144.1 unnamed protein product [Penicillium salamii]CAG8266030.1 unnamed protein product [Penicillium salamii]CAG8341569.1 unnamed protein product [Penicillium salamii]CAG8376870.1 unnamed protein product [Penicillium salamii]